MTWFCACGAVNGSGSRCSSCDRPSPQPSTPSPFDHLLCANCGHSEVQHRVDHTACHLINRDSGIKCGCTGYRSRADSPSPEPLNNADAWSDPEMAHGVNNRPSPEGAEPRTPDSFRDLFSDHDHDALVDVLYEQTLAAVAAENEREAALPEPPPDAALAEKMTRLADGPRSKWHDEVLPNGAGESWACVPIGDVLNALPAALPEPPLDVTAIVESFRYSEPLMAGTPEHSMWERNEETLDAIAARLRGTGGAP